MGRRRRAPRQFRPQGVRIRDARPRADLPALCRREVHGGARAIEAKASARRKIGPSDYHAQRVIYLTDDGAFPTSWGSLRAPTSARRSTTRCARSRSTTRSRGVLPKLYGDSNTTIASLLRHINSYTKDLEGDAFGLIYEYFLAKFALAEGQGAGEFFTPTSIVRLIVEIIEPFHGRIFDPACGSGGMFVQSAHFVERHAIARRGTLDLRAGEDRRDGAPGEDEPRGPRASGEIREGNSYYEDLHESVGRFDFVMANPPFNVDRIDKAKLDGDARFPDLPKADNGNYIWIQLFATALERDGSCRLRDGELGVRRAAQRGGDPPQADRRRGWST